MDINRGVQDSAACRRSDIWRADNGSGAQIGQEPVATFIAEEVIRDPDIRIALEGPWGSGKTRILSMIQQGLTGSGGRDVVVAWYAPWKYSPDETVLRRTLLDAIGRAVDEQCQACQGTITTARFYREIERVDKKPADNQKKDIADATTTFWAILKARSGFYVSFGALWTVLFLGAIWLQHWLPFLGRSPSIFVAAAGAALLAALVQDAVQAIQVVEVSPYIRTTLPKLDQIDQFEAEYRSVMECLANQNRNLVVLVDDLDRCNKQEIRTVMSGLTTYLEAPRGEPSGRVAFVVAMDENKIVDALRGQNHPGVGRQNVIQKHFHLVVPVPVPTDTALLKVLDATLGELSWNVPPPTRRRMAHLIAAHAGSNLRLLRSTVVEAHTIEKYYRDVLAPQGIKVAPGLVEEPILRFRIALIREITPSDALRSFLSDPTSWLGRKPWPPEIPKVLFDMAPSFARNQLDPRPLLGLAPGMMLAAIAPTVLEVSEAFRTNNPQMLDLIVGGCQPEALITLVSLIIAAGLIETPPQQVAPVVFGLIGILHKAERALVPQDLDTFTVIVDHLKRHVPSNQLPSPNYRQWVEVAVRIGNDALNELFQTSVPLLQANHEQQMLNELLTAAENGDIDARVAYQIEARLRGAGNWESLFPIAMRLVKAGKLGACPEIHELQIQCMEKWNYGQKPEGPPRDLYANELVQGMSQDLQERAAKAYQIAANQQQEKTREFVAALPHDWPTSRTPATAS